MFVANFAWKTRINYARDKQRGMRKGMGWERFGEIVVKTCVCGLNCVVFGEVCGDVDVGTVRI
jgi:hypothetical protein